MIVLRSIVFNIVFYINLIGLLVLGLPMLVYPSRHGPIWLARAWGFTSLWWLDKICNIKVEFRGLEHIPTGGFIIAPKHHSIWETFALTTKFPDFSFVLKRELTWIPFFGWYLIRGEQIAINRAKGSTSLGQVTRWGKKIIPQGRQIFLFPEGTRRQAGAPPSYKYGVAQVYTETGAVCLPVALNSGLFWARRKFIRRPGTVLVEFLEPIQPGLGKQEFLTLLQDRIETVTNHQIEESIAKDPSLRDMLAQPEK